MKVQRLVVLRQPSGYQREVLMSPSVREIRVPVLSERGFGSVGFEYSGKATVQGLPVYESDVDVWHEGPL